MSIFSRLKIFKELWKFLRARKKWWLAPIVIFLILFGFMILIETSAIGPIIYTLF